MSDTEPQMQLDAGADQTGVWRQPVAADVGGERPVTKNGKTKTGRGHLPRRISAWVLVVLASSSSPSR